MFELTTGADALGLQSLSEMPGLWRHRHRRRSSYRSTTCLVTLNHSLNGINILNILNGFG